jgi:TetR/AcrR family transcriptional regulator, repressor for uid operon
MRTRNPILNDTRRRAILVAASTCFVKQGFHSTAMKDICIAAGMSPGTLYHYFASKTDIIVGIIAADGEITRALLAPLADAADFLETLFAILDAIAADLTAEELALHTEIAAEILRQPALRAAQLALDGETQAMIADSLRTAQARQQIDRTLEPQHTAKLVLAVIDGLLWRATVEGVSALAVCITAAKQALARMLLEPERTL